MPPSPLFWLLVGLLVAGRNYFAIGFTAVVIPVRIRARQLALFLSNDVTATSGAQDDTTTTTAATDTPHLRLSLVKPWSAELQQALEAALEDCAASTDFFIRADVGTNSGAKEEEEEQQQGWEWKCRVPAFGDDCQVHFQLEPSPLPPKDPEPSSSPPPPHHLVLSLYGSGSAIDTDAFAWVCKKFYECREPLELAGVDCFEPLRRVVVQLCNTLPADPGIRAATARWSPKQQRQFKSLLPNEDDGGIRGLLEKLDKKGFVVIDSTKDESDNASTTTTTAPSPLTTSVSNQNKLSSYLAETTGQGDDVRTDRVHFLSRPQAVNCGIAPQYDLLMGLANYLNHHQDQPIPRSECLQPIAPATTSRQLTVPRTIQFAEYGANDFYTAHSDNSLTDQFTKKDDRIRRNFRAYTCILYLNNDWDSKQDGGALRIYPESQQFESPEEAVRGDGYFSASSSIDISPVGGRMLIFDSRLVHSVEPVTTTKVRRALTVWINRPNNSGVRGETFY